MFQTQTKWLMRHHSTTDTTVTIDTTDTTDATDTTYNYGTQEIFYYIIWDIFFFDIADMSSIISKPAYGVYVSQLVRIGRIRSSCTYW